MWPTIAASPAAAGAAGFPPKRSARITLTAPVATSSAATRMPAFTPEARITLAAPTFPLPTSRRSAAPQRRASSSAKGTDPMRYAATMIAIMKRAALSSKPRTSIRQTTSDYGTTSPSSRRSAPPRRRGSRRQRFGDRMPATLSSVRASGADNTRDAREGRQASRAGLPPRAER